MFLLANYIDPAYIALGIITLLVILYITEILHPTLSTILALLAFVLTGAAPAQTAFAGFSHNNTYMIAGVLIVGEAIMASGCSTIIGKACIKFSRGSEKLFIILCMIATALLSAFLDNTTMLAVFLTIMVGAKTASKASGNTWSILNMCMPVCLSAMIGGALSLVGCTVNLAGNAVLLGLTQDTLSFGMFDFTPIAAIILIVIIIWFALWGYKRGIRIWGNREDTMDGSQVHSLTEVDMSKIKRVSVIVILLMAGFVSGIFSTGVVALTCAVLCCLFKIIDFKTIMKQMNWDIIVRTAATLGVASCLSYSGFVDFLGNNFVKIFGENISPWTIYILGGVFSLLMSQFMGNSATVTVMATPIGAIAINLGINPIPIIMGITLAGSFAFCTSIAGTCVMLSTAAGYQFKDYMRYNWQPTLICLAGIMLIPFIYHF